MKYNHIGNTTAGGRYYITVFQRGRLGNQMFQYAALFGTACKNRALVPFIQNTVSLIQNTFETSLTLPVVNVSPSNFTVIRENKPPDRMLEYLRYLPKSNVLLQGYFLSHKYFANVKHDVRKEFTFSRRIQQEVREYYKNISPIQWKKKRFERVGIHVRRTDLIALCTRQNTGCTPTPRSYFTHAMDYFNKKYKNVQFIIATDDKAWFKKNIIGTNVVISSHNYTMDLAILTLSDHIIISIGTYSW